MKEYLPEYIIAPAIKHAQESYPNESCGMVINGKYKPYKNIADDPVNEFKIHSNAYILNEGNIDFIIHSHCDTETQNDTGHASKSDMLQQIATNVPWCLIHINKYGNYTRHFCWGDQLPPQDLIGRPFAHGIYDCYTLVRDYYRINGIGTLPIFPRSNHFWKEYNNHKPENMIINGMNQLNLTRISMSELQVGDACFAQIQAPIVNHCAIFLGNGLVLHHLYHKLSCREPMMRYREAWKCFIRYTGE